MSFGRWLRRESVRWPRKPRDAGRAIVLRGVAPPTPKLTCSWGVGNGTRVAASGKTGGDPAHLGQLRGTQCAGEPAQAEVIASPDSANTNQK